MHIEELKNPNYLEIKLFRLTAPLFNNSNIPLSGLYNELSNIESKEYELKSKFKNFDIDSPDFINKENLFTIKYDQNEKILLGERMDYILTFVNNSKDNLIVKDLIAKLVSNNERIKSEKRLELKFEENKKEIIIPAYKSYSMPLKFKIKTVCKFQLNIFCSTKSKLYNDDYFKRRQRNIIRETTSSYIIRNNHVKFQEFKKFELEVFNPFIVKEKFFNINVNQCLISIKIKNNTDNILTITDLKLNPKEKPNIIKLVKSLEEIKNCGKKKENDSKYLSLQPKEELMTLFKIEDPDLFYDNDNFTLYIFWLKEFDFNPKVYSYDFYNALNTYNNYFKLTIKEKPETDIILNQNFRIVINLKTKSKDKKYNISISQEQIYDDDDKSDDREIEIIDIIEKNIELNSKVQNNDFILICKSDILGNIYLPKLKFTLTEGDINIPVIKIYDSLLSFNCVPK